MCTHLRVNKLTNWLGSVLVTRIVKEIRYKVRNDHCLCSLLFGKFSFCRGLYHV